MVYKEACIGEENVSVTGILSSVDISMVCVMYNFPSDNALI